MNWKGYERKRLCGLRCYSCIFSVALRIWFQIPYAVILYVKKFSTVVYHSNRTAVPKSFCTSLFRIEKNYLKELFFQATVR
jgi:hypothetical protein